MLLKCCVIIVVFLNSICCDDLRPETTTTNIKNVIDIMNTPLTKKTRITDKTGRYLNEYKVLTNDGYILTIFRLTYETNEPILKYPVLMVHGLFQSADRFLQQNQSQSLAFKLQDFGYDVWLANCRGNKYGRRHTTFGPTKEKTIFFNYTYEEIALYDISVTVDFILEETEHKKLHYIGYSLGGTSFLVLNSMEPKYNDKFDTAHLLAPIGYQKYFPNSDLKTEASKCDELYKALLNANTVEIFPYKPTNEDISFSTEDCLGNKTYKNICNLLKINESMGIKSQGNDIDQTRGGSIKQLIHLAQNVKSNNFSRWDYGEKGNKEHYGVKEPPKYNLDLITVPTIIIFAPSDEYVSAKDIADMAADMANATTRKIYRMDFKHNDFFDAADAMKLVYDNIVNDLEMNANSKAVARQQMQKLKNKKDTTNASNVTSTTEKSDEEKLDDAVDNFDWVGSTLMGALGFCLVFAVCLLRSVDMSCYMEL